MRNHFFPDKRHLFGCAFVICAGVIILFFICIIIILEISPLNLMLGEASYILLGHADC
jgi:hypothetical protein